VYTSTPAVLPLFPTPPALSDAAPTHENRFHLAKFLLLFVYQSSILGSGKSGTGTRISRSFIDMHFAGQLSSSPTLRQFHLSLMNSYRFRNQRNNPFVLISFQNKGLKTQSNHLVSENMGEGVPVFVTSTSSTSSISFTLYLFSTLLPHEIRHLLLYQSLPHSLLQNTRVGVPLYSPRLLYLLNLIDLLSLLPYCFAFRRSSFYHSYWS